jgi:putative transposase
MTTISFARHQFPPAIVRHTVWLYLRFTLSYRDVEDLLAERGLDGIVKANKCRPFSVSDLA